VGAAARAAATHYFSQEQFAMSSPHESRSNPQPMLIGLALGLLLIAAVPGVGWMWGQFYETIVLCIGGALLLYAGFAYMAAVNGRLAALEQRFAELDRAKR
jgi:hypothetical protein